MMFLTLSVPGTYRTYLLVPAGGVIVMSLSRFDSLHVQYVRTGISLEAHVLSSPSY
jgi:hypothetical protein